MKKLSLLLIVLLITSFSGYSQNSKAVATTDEVGKYTFNVLKNLDNTSEKEFVNSLFTIDELKEFVNKHTDSLQDIKQQINSMEDGEYYKRVSEVYNEMKGSAKQFNIVLKDITYSDFTFEERTDEGLKGIRGKVTFKYKETEYQVRVAALEVDNKYIPVIIRKIRPKN